MALPRAAPLLLLLTLLLLTVAACGGEEEGIGDITGEYALDREQFARQLLKERIDARTPAARAALTPKARRALFEQVRAIAGASEIRLDLLAGGAFVVRYRFGKEEGRRRGTWTLRGTAVTLRTTHTPAGALTTPSELVGAYEAGALGFPASDAVPHPFVLRRR